MVLENMLTLTYNIISTNNIKYKKMLWILKDENCFSYKSRNTR